MLLFRGRSGNEETSALKDDDDNVFRARKSWNRNVPVIVRNVTYVHVLCLAWLAVLWYGERIYPRGVLRQCEWWTPANVQHTARIALVADPQLVDDNTYPGRPQYLLSLTQYITDHYLRKCWNLINHELNPDTTVFLGDLFDGGREWDDATWLLEFERWNRIYNRPADKRTIMSLPGNHDIGFGNTIVPRALSRFKSYFGETSSSFDIGNHTIVLLDTISMMNTIDPTISSPPREFIKKLNADTAGYGTDLKPRILLTHVPLYRPADAPCGRYRESEKALPYTYGKQYETQIQPELSQEILANVRPIAVFSGDDHDACHVSHTYEYQGETRRADEFTVKSASMAAGIQHPGIQLLTLNSDLAHSDPVGSYHTSICLLPSPFWPFMCYAAMAALSVAALLAFNFRPHLVPPRLRFLQKASHDARSTKSLPLPLHHTKSKPVNDKLGANKKYVSIATDVALIGGLFLVAFAYLNHSLF